MQTFLRFIILLYFGIIRHNVIIDCRFIIIIRLSAFAKNFQEATTEGGKFFVGNRIWRHYICVASEWTNPNAFFTHDS